jgi:hypothetical protein
VFFIVIFWDYAALIFSGRIFNVAKNSIWIL